MTELIQPDREVERVYFCQCTIQWPAGLDPCMVIVGPDIPFCEDCEDRHPEHDSNPEATVMAKRLPGDPRGLRAN